MTIWRHPEGGHLDVLEDSRLLESVPALFVQTDHFTWLKKQVTPCGKAYDFAHLSAISLI